MERRTRIGIVATLAGAVIAGGTAAAVASGGDDVPLTGDVRSHAVAVALDHVGDGTVTETEAGDDGAAYSVGIRLADGSQVDVLLDARFEVIGTESDDDGAADAHGDGSVDD